MRHILMLIVAVLLSSTAFAQFRVDLTLNIDRQPIWGPTGYDHVEYYYLPDIEVYYNVPLHRYYYYEGGRWMNNSALPSRYRGFDLYHSHKVVVNEPAPYLHHKLYRTKYSSFKGRNDQEPIRDSRDARYFVNANHPEHNTWVKQQRRTTGNGNGNGNGHGNGNGNGHGNGNGNGHENGPGRDKAHGRNPGN